MLLLPPNFQADHGELGRQGQEQDLPNNCPRWSFLFLPDGLANKICLIHKGRDVAEGYSVL
jgi:hypothetical protein